MKLKAWLLTVLMLAATAAQANPFTLDRDGCGVLTCGTAPFGTVSVTQAPGGALTFLVELQAGYSFHDTDDANHHALVFSLVGDPTINISVASPFAAPTPQPAATNASPFGSFDYVVNYPRIQGSHTNPTSFSFTAMPQTGVLTLASLEANAGGYWFAADITGANGVTGNVAAVPEPSHWLMLLAGLVVVGFITGRRTHNELPA
jgi:hypothetical protein